VQNFQKKFEAKKPPAWRCLSLPAASEFLCVRVLSADELAWHRQRRQLAGELSGFDGNFPAGQW